LAKKKEPGGQRPPDKGTGEPAEKAVKTKKATAVSKDPGDFYMVGIGAITDLKRSDYLEGLEYHKGMPCKDLLILAMKWEEKELALYNHFLDHADTEESKNLFQILCQEDAKHKLKLEKTFDDYEL
jgi:hypothetical protein